MTETSADTAPRKGAATLLFAVVFGGLALAALLGVVNPDLATLGIVVLISAAATTLRLRGELRGREALIWLRVIQLGCAAVFVLAGMRFFELVFALQEAAGP